MWRSLRWVQKLPWMPYTNPIFCMCLLRVNLWMSVRCHSSCQSHGTRMVENQWARMFIERTVYRVAGLRWYKEKKKEARNPNQPPLLLLASPIPFVYSCVRCMWHVCIEGCTYIITLSSEKSVSVRLASSSCFHDWLPLSTHMSAAVLLP